MTTKLRDQIEELLTTEIDYEWRDTSAFTPKLLTLIDTAVQSARQEERERIDVWVRQVLFDHDGSQGEYEAWSRQWDKFLNPELLTPASKP